MNTPYFMHHWVTCLPSCEGDFDCGGCPCHGEPLLPEEEES